MYCPGPRAVFTLQQNSENVADIPQSVLDEKLVSLNVASVADVCNSSSEAVSAILNGIRDETLDCVLKRKATVNLNFGIGTLTLSKGGAVEFKSAAEAQTANDQDEDPIKESPEFDGQSTRLTEVGLSRLNSKNGKSTKTLDQMSEAQKKSIAERSLIYMQQRQPNQRGMDEIRSSKSKARSNVTSIRGASENPYMDRRATRNTQDKAPTPKQISTLNEGDFSGKGGTFDHLNSFLKNQIESGRKSTARLGTSQHSRGPTNNALIEYAAQMHQTGNRDKAMEIVRSASANTTAKRGKNVGLSKIKVS